MKKQVFAKPVVALLCVALTSFPSASFAAQTIQCSSEGGRYRYCRVDTDNDVRLERRLSGARCNQGESWGYDRRGVWVDRGCRAEFRVGRGGSDKAAIGAAIAGVAVIAALAAHNSAQQSQDVPSWAVGEFTGYDDFARTDVRMSIYPGGNVSGYAGRDPFEGRFQGSRLETSRYTFRIERSGNGFLAIDERDAGHRVHYRRSGGY
jgi:hypothetical protein